MIRNIPSNIYKFVIKSSGCWTWTGARSKAGYGVFRMGNKNYYAHRIMYALCVGEVLENMCVLHKCDNPQCTNPNHLFIGTREDNVHDMIKKKRGHNQKKTHCPHGHKYTENNIIWERNQRRCRTCRTLQRKTYVR